MAQQSERGKTVVILGGGVGGLVTARELRRKLGREHRIVVVDREDRHTFTPSFLWLMVGMREPDRITRDLARLRKRGIDVVKGEVASIDPEQKQVVVGGETMNADYLVVSLGAELAPERIPGLAEAGFNLYTLDGATAIRDARAGLTEGNLVVLVAGMPFKCPAAPYEAAMLLEHDLRRRGVRDRVSVSLYSPEPGPMGVAGPEMSASVREMVEQKQISYHPQHRVAEVDPVSKTVRFQDETEARYDFLVYVPPHAAPAPVRESGLVNETGWVPVDRHTLETRFPGVYAIGDVTVVPLAVGLPLPKAGTFALGQARAVARTIAAGITGRGEPGAFNGHGECFIEIGGGKAGIGSGNFYAEPRPTVRLRRPGRLWHWAKVWFEKRWFRRWL